MKLSRFFLKNFFNPLPDGIFEKFQRIWKAVLKYYRSMWGQNARFRPGKGSFLGSNFKKKFWDSRIFGLIKGIPPVGHTVAIFSIFFLQKIANLKPYFFTAVPSKNVDCSATNAPCSQQSCCNKRAVLIKTCDFCDFLALWKAKAFLFSCKCHLHVLKCHLYTLLP